MPRDARSRSELDRPIFGVLTLAGLAAWVAPARLLAWAPPCLFSLLTHHPCWGCGMLHAILAVLRGDLARAWVHNPRVVIVLPLLVLEYLRLARRVLPWTWIRHRSAPYGPSGKLP